MDRNRAQKAYVNMGDEQRSNRAIRAPIRGLSAGEIRLGNEASHYLGRVLRLRPGGQFVAFDPDRGIEGEATVVSVTPDEIVISIARVELGNDVRLPEIKWVQGIAKGEKCDAIVRDITELGATEFQAVSTERCVVKFDPTRSKNRQDRWKRIADEAARQCGRKIAPAISPIGNWNDVVARKEQDNEARFCLYEHAKEPLANSLKGALEAKKALVFAVGPEGGLAPDEVLLAERHGWTVASLGPLILRTETVASAVLGAVRIWR